MEKTIWFLSSSPRKGAEFKLRPSAHENGGLCGEAMEPCLWLQVKRCQLHLTRPLSQRLHSNLPLQKVCISAILVIVVYLSSFSPRWALTFPLLRLTLTVLPLPALNKDNYSGNISANQARPCISPARKATSQDLATIVGPDRLAWRAEVSPAQGWECPPCFIGVDITVCQAAMHPQR